MNGYGVNPVLGKTVSKALHSRRRRPHRCAATGPRTVDEAEDDDQVGDVERRSDQERGRVAAGRVEDVAGQPAAERQCRGCRTAGSRLVADRPRPAAGARGRAVSALFGIGYGGISICYPVFAARLTLLIMILISASLWLSTSGFDPFS